MRLHSLRIQAFGPFTDVVDIDFDQLSAQGLFLLHGATGAGKSSILDAVCFALFGDVPGHRKRSAKPALRSHLAEPEAEPLVECRFSVGERKLEVVRSPAWERPKKRGTGTTPQQASVRVREHDGSAWQVVSSRLDEAGDFLSSVIGMDREQFTKVVLLPQGDFAAFLHSPDDQRRDLLQKLFGTERFEKVEGFLVERRRELTRAVETGETRRRLLTSRLSDAWASVADVVPLPDVAEEDGGQTGAEAIEDALGAAVVKALREGVGPDTRIPALEALREERHRELDRHRTELVEQQDFSQRLREWQEAQDELSCLRSRAQEHEAEVARLAAARRASGARGHLERLARDERELRDAERDQAEALAVVVPLLSAQVLPGMAESGLAVPTQAELVEASDRRRRELGRLDGLLELEQQLGAWEKSLAQAQEGHDALERGLAGHRGAQAQARAELEQSRVGLASALRSAAQLPDREATLSRAEEVARAAEALPKVTAGLTAAEDARRTSVDHAQSLRARELDLQQQRLEGMAAELASALADGTPCPVCGSADHPEKASRESGEVVTAQAVGIARRAAEQAARAAEEHTEIVSRLRTEQATLTQASRGLTPLQATTMLDQARESLEAVRRAVTAEKTLSVRVSELDQTLLRTAAEIEQVDSRLRSAAAEVTRVASRLTEARATVRQAVGEDAGVWARHDRISREAKLLEAAQDAVGRLELARSTVRRSRTAATRAARKAGFAGIEQARSAFLQDGDLEALASACAGYDVHVASVRDRLAQPRLALVSERMESAPTSAEAVAEALRLHQLATAASADAYEQATTRLHRVRQVSARLEEILTQVDAHDAQLAPVRERAKVASELAACVEGARGSNALRMRLSAYVLAARLEAVAQAASERLLAMSGKRYALVHTDALRRGTGRSGLGLSVLDSWTGRERGPESLSGGETFMASLALALGLADVVSAEVGGTRMETLFVDEGFGSLDDEALEGVMDILDSLREGGRAVGVVSHVAELRHRIPCRLEVIRDPAGSTVRLTAGA